MFKGLESKIEVTSHLFANGKEYRQSQAFFPLATASFF